MPESQVSFFSRKVIETGNEISLQSHCSYNYFFIAINMNINGFVLKLIFQSFNLLKDRIMQVFCFCF